MENDIKSQQWRVWLRQPETIEFFNGLMVMRADLVEAWASGDFTRDNIEGTVLLNAKAIGQVQLLDSILDIRTEKGLSDE
jgi:hypothetical protein